MIHETVTKLMTVADSTPQQILDFWFGSLDADGKSNAEFSQRWYKKDPDFDVSISTQFASIYEELVRAEKAGKRLCWLDEPTGLLAAIIVLDQFSRNMFRESAKMYEADWIAINYCFECIALGVDKKLPLHYRSFCYMPLMHSERLLVQKRSVELFETFANEFSGALAEGIKGNAEFARAHMDIVARWGRFPHRNEILERTSTPEEIEFLNTPGSSF